MYKTLIFDLDGTLLNTLNDLKDSTNFALEKYGYPPRTLEEVRCFVGNGVKLLMERALPSGSNNPDFENCLQDFKAHYKENMYNTTAPYDGILGMLDILNKKGIKIAVVSNKFDEAVKELCEKFFQNRIQTAIGESQNIRKKPAPDSVFEAMRILDAKKESTIFIGDSEVDVQTAKNAHITSIGVTWGFRNTDVLENEGADFIVDSTHSLLQIILD